MTAPGVMIVSPATASALKDTAGLAVRPTANIPDGAAFVDISTAARILERKGDLSRIVISPSQAVDRQAIAVAAPDLTIREAGGRSDVARLTDSFHLNLTAFGFLAFVVGLFIAYSATGLSFEQRRGTFRTLRSLGISLSSLTVMLVLKLRFCPLVRRLWRRSRLCHRFCTSARGCRDAQWALRGERFRLTFHQA